MIAVRFFKKLEAPIPSLPELDPLVGKMVEMIVMEDPGDAPADAAPEPELRGNTLPPPPVVPQSAAKMSEPPPLKRQRVRLCGLIDRVSDGGDSFRLVIDRDNAVPCAWASDGPSPAMGSAGHKMVVAGTGIFDHTGTLLRVDVKAGAVAHQADLRFARVPAFGEPEPEEAEEMPAYEEPEPLLASVTAAPAPPEPPRPAFSARSSFRELFGAAEPAETE